MIKLRLRDLENIILHCKEEWPIEACGVLAGKIEDKNGVVAKRVLKVYNCRNELNSSTEYRIGAEEQFRIFSEIDGLGLDLLGFYHSHTSYPYTTSGPSSIDEERANYYGYSYVIVALYPTKVSSWTLEKEGVFKEEEIRIIKQNQCL